MTAVAASKSEASSGFTGTDKPAWEDYARCVHCGLCLNHCPTYRLWGLEADSPRGRIRQMLLVDEGRMQLGATFVQHIDQCLDCRACETACPSGVEYGKLVEAARAEIEQNYRRPLISRLARNFVFGGLLPHPRRIAAVARLLRFYQRSGLQRLARASGVLRLLGLAERERLLPPVDNQFFFSQLGQVYPAQGPKRARVALFAGCMAQVTFSRLNEATIRVLQANGCEVVVPAGQVCCGALCAHAGYRDVARELARRNLEVFLNEDVDAVVTNAAGCGSTLKEYAHLLPIERTANMDRHRGHRGAEDTEKQKNEESEKVAKFTVKVRDVTEFLCDLGWIAPLREVPLRVTYQDSCHLVHGQRVREAPRELIRSIPGVELVEMPLADHCCGSAGVYNVTQTAASMDLLREKMRLAASTGVQAIVTANPGCILQLRAGLEMFRDSQAEKPFPKEVLHVVEILDRGLLPV